ncbi:MAG: CvpA family protein [Pseudomonadota bacterium]|nr:CvpA family protein [Pseudomonadota bacterium]
MIWVDYILLAVIAISGLLSLWRGFVMEAISLVSWIAALWVAMIFFRDLANLMEDWIDTASIRDATAFAILFVSTVLVGGLVNFLAGQLVAKTGLTATDRALGMLFGIARGVVIVAVLVLLAGLTALPQDAWWQEALLLGHFQDMALWLRSFLPANIAENIRF